MIVVTGATGNIGAPLVRSLSDAGEEVTAVARHADLSLPDGVRSVRADLGEPESLSPALSGADTLFLLITGEQLVAGPEPEQVLKVAAAGGVRRVVFVSSQGVATRPDAAGYARLVAYEQAIRDSGLAWTFLRPAGFFSNTYAWAASVRTQRMVAAPFGDIGLPSIDPADIAAVAAAALRDERHAGQVYTLTGPELATPRAQAEALGAALGEPLGFMELTRAQAHSAMLDFMPEPVVEHTLTILGEPTPAEQLISPDVPRVLGRPATKYAEWAIRNRAAFA
ncbi:SDR family oxidoreductase [Nocardia gamkensis]|uniref:NAD(P)H-binding protein n=1 Tax=Nocardia gamkensis TaxID=352869 RepID=A0A7X6L8F1_9NOCA|nr:NAD(P)H-binding protein [Nocardia gamkensis]NKY29781.1 NAD(P)H-binding protein [Nocardia gamkensis]NQE70347.1 NAD(P)H azoreductase [Nocardia gamkensis]